MATFTALTATIFLMSAFMRRPLRVAVSNRRTAYLSQSSCDHVSVFNFASGTFYDLLKGTTAPSGAAAFIFDDNLGAFGAMASWSECVAAAARLGLESVAIGGRNGRMRIVAYALTVGSMTRLVSHSRSRVE
jgi:hypothetical protein